VERIEVGNHTQDPHGRLCRQSRHTHKSLALNRSSPAAAHAQVDGPLWAWQEIVHRLLPHPHASVRELSGPEVLELCPVAHRYNISAVLADCVARAQGGKRDEGGTCMCAQRCAIRYDCEEG